MYTSFSCRVHTDRQQGLNPFYVRTGGISNGRILDPYIQAGSSCSFWVFCFSLALVPLSTITLLHLYCHLAISAGSHASHAALHTALLHALCSVLAMAHKLNEWQHRRCAKDQKKLASEFALAKLQRHRMDSLEILDQSNTSRCLARS